ncbi:MAG: hypothetical protein HC767_13240 [Akkermansiaceae bacterium]|nr:hypothetical protein [Akkermansiaceae bacterium]
MKRIFLGLILIGLITSCSTLPNPSSASKLAVSGDATKELRKSAIAQGDSWRRAKLVKVKYSGEWTDIAIRVQPILTDPGFRESSIETYQPQRNRVQQIHFGPMGQKEVIRENQKISVKRNGIKRHQPRNLGLFCACCRCLYGFLIRSLLVVRSWEKPKTVRRSSTEWRKLRLSFREDFTRAWCRTRRRFHCMD